MLKLSVNTTAGCSRPVCVQYILSSGKDSLVKLWELSTNRCLIVYTGAGATGKMEQRTQAVFNHTEDYGQYDDAVLSVWRDRLFGLVVRCLPGLGLGSQDSSVGSVLGSLQCHRFVSHGVSQGSDSIP